MRERVCFSVNVRLSECKFAFVLIACMYVCMFAFEFGFVYV